MSALISLLVHSLSCLLSLYLGLRFSRLLSLSLPLPLAKPISPPSPLLPPPSPPIPSGHVIAGRHGILVRPWAHPHPSDTVRAHRILSAVQSEQRRLHISPNLPSPPKKFLVVTTTYSRTFQTIHLSSLAHSLLLIPFPFTWILVEPISSHNDTSAVLSRFAPNLSVIRVTFPGSMPTRWAALHQTESKMRILALREIRERRMEGIIVFLDESNVHSLEFFDEAQKVKWIGSLSIGILTHSGYIERENEQEQEEETKEKYKENKSSSDLGLPIVGPACNASGKLVGWHSFNSSKYKGKIAKFVGEEGLVLPQRVEWAGFVVDSRLVWEKVEGRPDWVREFNAVGPITSSPLDLVWDKSFVEPLGNCGKRVLLWWARAEAHHDCKFPSRWIIDEPLEITVPAKQTPWPDKPTKLPVKLPPINQINRLEEPSRKSGRSSRSRRRSRGKRKREPRVNMR